MPSILALISKSEFDKLGAEPGRPLDLTCYRSQHASLTPLAGGGDLYLVTVRPRDELWLVAVLRTPRLTKKGWEASANTQPFVSAASIARKLTFSTGKGVSREPGKLGMSLQTPRVLTEGDEALLRGLTGAKAKTRPPTKTKAPARTTAASGLEKKLGSAVKKTASSKENAAPKAALSAPSTSPVAAIIEGRMEQAIVAVRELTARATASVVPAILPWVDLDKWRSTEATSFWVYTYFLLMCFGGQRDVKILRRPPPHRSHSQMHRSLLRIRSLAADVIELRQKPKPQRWTDAPVPKTRAQVMDHIAKRLGDPRWKQGKELVALAAKPSFSLQGEEGLHVFAALLLHGEPDDLAPLKSLARHEPIFAQILAARGASTESGNSGAGEHERGELLRQAVLDDPANDAPRAVYADWLLEQGDPRGEAIAAQLAGKSVTIEPTSALAWAGEVRGKLRWRAPFANEKAFHLPRYSRGFLSGVAVDALDGDTADSTDWATIEVLDVHGRNVDQIADYELRSLVVIGGLSEKNLDAVLDRPDLVARLVGIGVRPDPRGRGDLWDRLAELKQLRLLAVGGGALVRTLFDHRLMSQLEVLAVEEDVRLPKSIRERVTTVGTYRFGDRWLAHYDLVMQHLAR